MLFSFQKEIFNEEGFDAISMCLQNFYVFHYHQEMFTVLNSGQSTHYQKDISCPEYTGRHSRKLTQISGNLLTLSTEIKTTG